LRGHLDGLVLAALESGPAHGWDIARRLDQEPRGVLKLKEGSLYPALYRLEQLGLVVGKWETETVKRRGPKGRVYHLTPKGKRRLAETRAEWKLFVTVLGNLLGAPA